MVQLFTLLTKAQKVSNKNKGVNKMEIWKDIKGYEGYYQISD